MWLREENLLNMASQVPDIKELPTKQVNISYQ